MWEVLLPLFGLKKSMADINWLAVVFEGLLAAIAGLLLVTYILFLKMNDDVRRARLYIMADRIKRFLLAFFIGFFALMVVILVGFAGVSLPAWVSGPMIFAWMGFTVYGCLELLFIAAPIKLRRSRSLGAADGGIFLRRDLAGRTPRGRNGG